MTISTRWANRLGVLASAALLVAAASAKTSRPPVPEYVLRAHTVAVMVDPEVGIDLSDPGANQTAQKDVETALLNWGRFQTVMGQQQADLIIVVRKGHGRLVDDTVSDPRQNSRAGVINSGRDGIGVGAQHGAQPGLSSDQAPDGTRNGAGGARPQMEAGATDDSFTVYGGGGEHPMDSPAAWRWVRRDGLHAHDVPAVDEFRKAIAEAEKQAAKQGQKKP